MLFEIVKCHKIKLICKLNKINFISVDLSKLVWWKSGLEMYNSYCEKTRVWRLLQVQPIVPVKFHLSVFSMYMQQNKDPPPIGIHW